MLEVAAWIIPVIRKIQTRWGQQDLGEEKLITVTIPPGKHTHVATDKKASWHQ